MTAMEMFNLSGREAAATIVRVWEKVREWQSYIEKFGASAQSIEQAIRINAGTIHACYRGSHQ
jgi:hypothetical protein